MKITFIWDSNSTVADLVEEIEGTISTELTEAIARHSLLSKEFVVMLTAQEPHTSFKGIVLDHKGQCVFDLSYALTPTATARITLPETGPARSRIASC